MTGRCGQRRTSPRGIRRLPSAPASASHLSVMIWSGTLLNAVCQRLIPRGRTRWSWRCCCGGARSRWSRSCPGPSSNDEAGWRTGCCSPRSDLRRRPAAPGSCPSRRWGGPTADDSSAMAMWAFDAITVNADLVFLGKDVFDLLLPSSFTFVNPRAQQASELPYFAPAPFGSCPGLPARIRTSFH